MEICLLLSPDTIEEVWFKLQSNTNLFTVHFVCTNKRSTVVNRRLQEIEVTNVVTVEIDSVHWTKIPLRITMKGFKKRLWNIVCGMLFRSGLNIWAARERLRGKESKLLKSRPADVSSHLRLFRMSYVSLNKLPFLYCHEESLTINISRKAQDER